MNAGDARDDRTKDKRGGGNDRAARKGYSDSCMTGILEERELEWMVEWEQYEREGGRRGRRVRKERMNE